MDGTSLDVRRQCTGRARTARAVLSDGGSHNHDRRLSSVEHGTRYTLTLAPAPLDVALKRLRSSCPCDDCRHHATAAPTTHQPTGMKAVFLVDMAAFQVRFPLRYYKTCSSSSANPHDFALIRINARLLHVLPRLALWRNATPHEIEIVDLQAHLLSLLSPYRGYARQFVPDGTLFATSDLAVAAGPRFECAHSRRPSPRKAPPLVGKRRMAASSM